MSRSNPSFLNGVPELLLLRFLSRREMYGYEIVRTIQSETSEIFSFGEGCIYPYLHYLEKKKLVSSRRLKEVCRSRYYYRSTAHIIHLLEKLTGEWNQMTQGIALMY